MVIQFTPEDAAGASVEIDRGLHAVNAPFWGFPNVVYVLESAGRLAIVDTGVSETPELALDGFIRAHGGYDAIDLVVGTHAHLDHIGGNAWFSERSSTARFAVGAKDVGWAEDPDRHFGQLYVHGCPGHWRPDAETEAQIRRGIGAGVPIDQPLHGGEELSFGDGRVLRTVALGSHTPGQTLYIDEATGSAFTGDAIQNKGIMNRDAGLRDFPMFGNVRDYRRALERIRSSGFERLCTAHAGVFSREAGDAFLDEALAFADAIAVDVRSIASQLGRFSIEELVESYLERHPEYANGLQIRVTLPEFAGDLVADGTLTPTLEDGEKVWSTTR